MLIALGGENSLSNSLVRSGRDRPIVVLAAPRHQHEDDARMDGFPSDGFRTTTILAR